MSNNLSIAKVVILTGLGIVGIATANPAIVGAATIGLNLEIVNNINKAKDKDK
jgi:hypothetical protein